MTLALIAVIVGSGGAEGAPSPESPPWKPPAEPQDYDSGNPGQLSSLFRIDAANPEASVPSNVARDRNPLEFGYYLQDLLERAEQARKAKDFQGVIRYYRAVAKAVPDNAKGWSKLCEAYEIVNDRDRAIRACRYAIDRPAAELQDYMRYVHLLLKQPGALGDGAKAELAQVLGHLDKQPGTEITASHLRCETGVKLKDVAMLEACTRTLGSLAPDDPKTVVFQWSLALMKGQADEARELLIRARATGVVAENVAQMEELTLSSTRGLTRNRAGILLGAILLVVIVGTTVILTIRRRRDFGSPRATA